ncbi:TonB-dependent receptor plug domain-containing protein [Winogradskyella sp. UBA3174]|uniref:TonB-dependent receptor plug domain-containing protein n=1 Tax=Winogradskyella sp. UBA3174 TaxID=1947785 RepID=UPI0025FEEA2F|nr:TonB-dependent receptor plug domain-containing protein [Winogradskyella sp. UBA3174]|tara:strand:+ start:15788 stop:18082 length:2295 start_codon:yes stop_codon:yes gene_type:complete
MVKQIKRFSLALLLSLLFSLKVNAQDVSNKLPLIEILTALETQFNIQFNYAEDAISSLVIAAPPKEISLKNVLIYLEDKTGFMFSLTNDNTVLVIATNNSLELQKLSEIVVEGYIVRGINKLSDGSFEIDISDFDILPGLVDTDVLQAVQAFPGIQSINETVSNINIRGGTHDQNLILWDDIKMYQSGHFFGLISMFNPQITQRVSLTKNGSQVEFTDGVSGIISMETDKEVSDEFKGSLGINFIDANGFADVPISEKSSLQVAVRKSISNFTETPTYNNFFERISQDTEVENNTMDILNSDKEFDFYDISLRWLYRINDKEELRVNFINTANELLFNENTTINTLEDSRESSLRQNSIAGAIAYSKIWNDKWQTSFEGYETDYKLKSENANILDTQRFLQENKISETSLKLKANYKIKERLQLQSGYHFVETKITNLDDVDNPIFRLLVSEIVRTHGVFSQLSYKSEDRKTNLNTGFRYNYIGKFDKHLLEPRVSLSHKFFNYFSFEVLGEFKHQNTSQVINFQNDFLGIEKRRWQLSNNRDIPIIRSRQGSVGLSFNKSGWLISAEGYYKKVKGITTQSQGFQNQYEFVKTDGEYTVRGVDFIIRKQLTNFNTWLSYSYMNNNYIFKSLPEYSFPSNFDVTQAFTLGTNYTSERLKIAAGLNWNSGRPTTLPEVGNEMSNGDINYSETNSNQLQDYLRVDLSAMYDFKLSKTTTANLGLSVWNLLDKKNIINSFYRLNNGVVDAVNQYSLGITPNVVFRVNF